MFLLLWALEQMGRVLVNSDVVKMRLRRRGGVSDAITRPLRYTCKERATPRFIDLWRELVNYAVVRGSTMYGCAVEVAG